MQRRKRKLSSLSILIFFTLIYIIFNHMIIMSHEAKNKRNELLQQKTTTTQEEISKLDEEDLNHPFLLSPSSHSDPIWISEMETSEIKSIVPLTGTLRGIAKKLKVILGSGKQVMVKPVLIPGLLNDYTDVEDFDSKDFVCSNSVRRSNWSFQGFGEIASFHVDRILGLYFKPPVVGRLVPNHQLFLHDPTWYGWVRRLFPSHKLTPVAMIAWIEGSQPSSLTPYDSSILSLESPFSTKSIQTKERIRLISDALIFDALLDDHDRRVRHNWRKSASGRVLSWDNGLSFFHGPVTKSTCLKSILSAPLKGKKMCLFRKETINKLSMMNNSDNTSKTLGQRLEESLKNDPLFPVFDLGLYHCKERLHDPFRLKADAFFRGLDMRVLELLDHVEECIKKEGEGRVLV